MNKTRVNLTISSELLEVAKEKCINISKVLDKALREELAMQEITKVNKNVCYRCGLPVNNGAGNLVQQLERTYRLFHKDTSICREALEKRKF